MTHGESEAPRTGRKQLMTPPNIALGEITIDCSDTSRVAEFWGCLFGVEARPSDPGWYELGPLTPGGPKVNFQPVTEPNMTKARVHLDLWVDDLDAAVAAAVRLGGTQLGPVRAFAEGRVVVMADAEGTEFCFVALPG
jgi:predicted enzyme related to lactoylglutathione lyase